MLCRYLLCNKTSIVNLIRTLSMIASTEENGAPATEENETEGEREGEKQRGEEVEMKEMKEMGFTSAEDGDETPSKETTVEEDPALLLIDEELAKSATEVIHSLSERLAVYTSLICWCYRIP